ncbi:MAG TPA: sensor histidine kinase [Parafilimonas sp.]|nr:sensor histidine kinase [Parafilimonas sp.]
MVQTIYDITKAHGREIKTEPMEREGGKFIIYLPYLNKKY